MKQEIKLSDHFTYGRLLKFTLPSIVMMIFTSVYGVVDGFFVSNFVGKTPFAAVNFIMPFLMILGALGFMFGTGGSALVSCTLGEGRPEKANRIFSMLVYISLTLGLGIAVLGIVFLPAVAKLLGAQGQLLADCVLYGRVVLIGLPGFILQMEFQSFFITAEKPKLGLAVTVASGVANMVLDALLVGLIPMGLVGAALAMYRCARPEKRRTAGSLLVSAALTSVLTGITEPLEFTFLFAAPVLYVIHSVLAGAAYMLYLAWTMLKSGMKQEETAEKKGESTYSAGILLQILNMKSWVSAISLFSVYVVPYTTALWAVLAGAGTMLGLLIAASLSWCLFGRAIKNVYEKYRLPISILMALSLVYCAVTAVL